ncbi:MAG TPA: bifunctional serine/threonine-protein kinase/formylglycine-generating enzyme family protein [Blastocatellia bacterium]|nr:bifunctional serine/threonine-protein kinase/formylglycine-generating enzyme family protein [Blastocatellia bacterium]
MLGRTIGNYEVVSQFGEGGMGELYFGRHTRLAREVIIKTIRTEDFSPRQVEHLRDRLEREAFIQSQLDHPNIVRVYDFLASGDTTCIVMEYVPGRDLRRMISRETGPVPASRAVRLFKQVLAAVGYAHHFIYQDKSGERHQGIIHRDLKPANILVTPEDVVKVTDFGIVKVRGVKGGTQMGFNPGTPEYMSPEQARGRELDQRSDIYSLGVVFYEMLTGHVPFEDDGSGASSDYEIRRGHIELPVPSFSKYYPGVSSELEIITFKALEKNPDERYQTAQSFLEILEEFEQTGFARITSRTGSGRQTVVTSDRTTGRQKLTEAQAVVGAETVITDPNEPLTNNTSYNNYPKKPAPFLAPKRGEVLFNKPDPEKSKTPLALGIAFIVLLTIGVAYWLITRSTPPVGPDPNPPIPAGMISIPGGEFKMGRDDGNDFEKPAHAVRVNTFFIDATEVTNEQYKQFVDAQRRQPPKNWRDGRYADGEAPLPVVNVSWYDAEAYAKWAGKRLPTEEEWEYAARGADGRLYPYGNEWKSQFSSAAPFSNQPGELRAVGSYPNGASPFGVLDMAGNVAEWTSNDYKPYTGSRARPQEGQKVVRGGSFTNPPEQQTATDRYFNFPNRTFDYIGFRCAKDPR